MSKTLLVFGDKTFKLVVPDDAKVTFGPWSPPTKGNFSGDREGLKGTLRVYRGGKDNIIACITGVTGFRDLSLEYAEQVAREEGAVIWKSDKDGYHREENVKHAKDWVAEPALLDSPSVKRRKRR